MNEHHYYKFEAWFLDYHELNNHLEDAIMDENILLLSVAIRQLKEHLKKLQVLFGEYIEKISKGL